MTGLGSEQNFRAMITCDPSQHKTPWGKLADGRAEIDDTAGLCRRDRRIGQVEGCLIALCLGLREIGGIAAALSFQCFKLPL